MESKCIYLAIYALETNISMVDIFFEICHQPRMFEWNYMHHWGLKYACVDIDGVLCDVILCMLPLNLMVNQNLMCSEHRGVRMIDHLNEKSH